MRVVDYLTGRWERSGDGDGAEDPPVDEAVADRILADLVAAATVLGAPSAAATADPAEYEAPVRSLAEQLLADFRYDDPANGPLGALLDGDEPNVTYRLVDSATVQFVDRYRLREGRYDHDVEAEQVEATVGYLYGAALERAAAEACEEAPDGARLRAAGAQGTVTASRPPSDVGGHRLYAGDDHSVFLDALIHHLAHRRHVSYLERVRGRHEMFGENYREKRTLGALLDRWERYDGDLYFPAFAEQYAGRHFDPDGPTVAVLQHERQEVGPAVEGFAEGLHRRAR
jgi:hypothetical protein